MAKLTRRQIADYNAQCEAPDLPAIAEAQRRGIPASFMVSGGTLATIGSINLPLPRAYGTAWGTGDSIFGGVQYPGLNA